MGELIILEEEKRKQAVNKMMEGLGELYANAGEIGDRFFNLMMTNPALAIKRLPEFMSEIGRVNKIPEALCGGPNQDWYAPLYNALGEIYSDLPRDAREEGLSHILNKFDGTNYFYVQLQTELLRNPWLVADIYINRNLYWPGYEAPAKFVSEFKTWPEFKKGMDKFSPFFLALAVRRPKYSSLQLRSNFYSEFSGLVDSTLDGIAAMCAIDSRYSGIKEGTGFEAELKKDLMRYDTLFSDKIREKIAEEKWILRPDSSFIRSLGYEGWNWDGTKIEKL